MRRSMIVFGLLLTAFAVGAADRRPRILLSNDDGIDAPGIRAAYEELSRVGEVTVAAPAVDQSGAGHGVTYLEPITVSVMPSPSGGEGRGGAWYRIAARPATCVRLALASLLAEKPDLVVSGINRGANTGLTLYISGTLAAAREAAFDGIPALGVSLESSPRMDYGPGAVVTARIASQVLSRGLPPGIYLSVNIPAGPIAGIKVVPHSRQAGHNRFDRRENPRSEVYYWNLWSEPVDPDPQTDVGAVRQGFVAVTPLRVDLNDTAAIAAIEAWGLR